MSDMNNALDLIVESLQGIHEELKKLNEESLRRPIAITKQIGD